MKRASVALAVASASSLLQSAGADPGDGVGGMGGGGMPSGGGGGMSSVPSGPEYDPDDRIPARHAGSAGRQVQGRGHRLRARHRGRAPVGQRLADARRCPRTAPATRRAPRRPTSARCRLDDTSVQAHRELALALVKLNQTDKAHAELAGLKTKATACGDTCPDAADLEAPRSPPSRRRCERRRRGARARRVQRFADAPLARDAADRRRRLCSGGQPDQRAALGRGAGLARQGRDRARAAPRHPDLQGLRLAQEGRLGEGGGLLPAGPRASIPTTAARPSTTAS